MDYPLEVSFKMLAIARQLAVRDARGQLIFYVKQKAFKLKEEVTIFADTAQQQPLYSLRANRVLDFSATYNFTDAAGASLGAVRRQGMRSLWKAHYEVADARGMTVMDIREENAWTKVLDSLVGEVPVLGIFTGYLFHPAYIVTRSSGAAILRMKKLPAFLEGKFRIEALAPLAADDEQLALLSLVMMILLERRRG